MNRFAYILDIEEPEVEDKDALDDGDNENEGSIEHSQPANGLGKDNVQNLLGNVKLNLTHKSAQNVFAVAKHFHPWKIDQENDGNLDNEISDLELVKLLAHVCLPANGLPAQFGRFWRQNLIGAG